MFKIANGHSTRGQCSEVRVRRGFFQRLHPLGVNRGPSVTGLLAAGDDALPAKDGYRRWAYCRNEQVLQRLCRHGYPLESFRARPRESCEARQSKGSMSSVETASRPIDGIPVFYTTSAPHSIRVEGLNGRAIDIRIKRPVAGHPTPEIAAFVVSLKSAFSDTVIDNAIRCGKVGEPTFCAKKNGHMVGTSSSTSQTVRKVVDEALRDRHFCMGCDGSCPGQNLSCR